MEAQVALLAEEETQLAQEGRQVPAPLPAPPPATVSADPAPLVAETLRPAEPLPPVIGRKEWLVEDAAPVAIIQGATPEESQGQDRRVLIAILGALGAFAVPLLAVAFWKSRFAR